MKSRTLGSLVVVLLALGLLATSVSAAKPKLWLKQLTTAERAPQGTAANAIVELEGTCAFSQKGSLASNGKASDKLTLAPGEHLEECVGGKVAGSISSVKMAAAEENTAAITIKSSLHQFVSPWCVYAPPKTIALTAGPITRAQTTVTAALEVRASHGPCPASRTENVVVTVEDVESFFAFLTEVEG